MPPRAPASEASHARLIKTADLIMSTVHARHAVEVHSDPKDFREALFALLRSRMAAPVGRRRSSELDRAEALRKQGKTYQQIAATLHPAYGSWGTYQRQQCRERIQKALQARKKRAAGLYPSTNRPDVSSASPD